MVANQNSARLRELRKKIETDEDSVGVTDLGFLRQELLTLAKTIEPGTVLQAYDFELIATGLAVTIGQMLKK